MEEKINILVLEDDPNRIIQFRDRFFSLFNGREAPIVRGVVYYARTAEEAITLLKEQTHFDMIFLDHDLGDRVFVSDDDENTGSEVVRFLMKNANEYNNTRFIIHSFNPIGAESMFNNIKQNITRDVIRVPGIWTPEIFKSHIRLK